MIKIICLCDRCGKEIKGDVGYVFLDYHTGCYDGDLAGLNTYENKHYCKDCMSLFDQFLAPVEHPAAEPAGKEYTPLTEDDLKRIEGSADPKDDHQKMVEFVANDPEAQALAEKLFPSAQVASPVAKPTNKRGKVDKEKLEELYHKGWNNQEIAKELGCTDEAVRQYVKKHELMR